MAYYYLAASLPELSLGQPVNMDAAEYITLCRSHLSERDCQALDAIASESACDHPTVEGWRQREIQLRNAVARLRAQRLHTDASQTQKVHTGFEVYIEQGVEKAFQAPNPLQRERMLDELRWQTLNELQGTDGFGSASVVTYLLRLQLCKRWSTFNKEDGTARMESTLSAEPSDGQQEKDQ